MKNLIFVNGTMGAGKTTTCTYLKQLLPHAVFLDGDWCWDADPFVVTDETKAMVLDNITHLLNNFLACTAYENVIFCWVMHEEAIVRQILSRLSTENASVRVFTLTLTEEALRERLARDIADGKRQADIFDRSVARLPLYDGMNSTKIDVSKMSALDAAKQIADWLDTKA